MEKQYPILRIVSSPTEQQPGEYPPVIQQRTAKLDLVSTSWDDVPPEVRVESTPRETLELTVDDVLRIVDGLEWALIYRAAKPEVAEAYSAVAPRLDDAVVQRMTEALVIVAEMWSIDPTPIFVVVATAACGPDSEEERTRILENLSFTMRRLESKAKSMIGVDADGRATAGEDTRSDPENAEPKKLKVGAWSELGIGIDEKREYWGITPCPETGGVFVKRNAHRLALNGEQFEKLFDMLAASERGNTASRLDLCEAFGYTARSVGELRETTESLDTDYLIRKTAQILRKRLSNAMAELSRRLRGLVDGPAPPLDSSGEEVFTAFTVRHLLQDRK